MIPLWTTATFWSASRCGWAFSSLGAPWVAHRVCAMPVVPANRLGMRDSSSRTRPLAFTVRRSPDLPVMTMPAES